MVLVAYPLQGVAKFIRSYMYLYVISFAMGGAVLAAVFCLILLQVLCRFGMGSVLSGEFIIAGWL